MNIRIRITESLCYTPETNTTCKSTILQKKNKNKVAHSSPDLII